MAVKQSLKLYPGAPDVVGNKSKLRILWTSTQSGQSHNNNERTAYYWVSVNGEAEVRHSVSYTLPKNKTQTVVDVTIDVPHDDAGNCTVSVRTWMNTRISAGEVELSQETTLAPILRANGISASDAFIGGVLIVNVGRKSTSYYHSVHFQFGALSGYLTDGGEISEIEPRTKSSEYKFTIPDSWALQIPNAMTGTCTLTCKTYLGANLLGETSTKVLIKTDGTYAPLLSAKIVDINKKTVALTGNASRLVQFASTASVTLTASAKYGATIKSTEINGVKTASLEIQNVRNGAFIYSAIDSRGYETSQAVSLNVVRYVPLTALIEAVRGAQGTNGLTVKVKGDYYPGSFGAASNSLAVKISVNGEQFRPMNVVISGYSYTAEIALELDYQTAHTLEFAINDAIVSLNPVVTVPKATPTMMQGEDWTRFNGALYCVPPRYASDTDADETALEAWLDSLLATMPPVSTMPVAWNCYPAITGSTVFASLSKYTSGSYAVLHGASYDGRIYTKVKSAGVWAACKKGVIG